MLLIVHGKEASRPGWCRIGMAAAGQFEIANLDQINLPNLETVAFWVRISGNDALRTR